MRARIHPPRDPARPVGALGHPPAPALGVHGGGQGPRDALLAVARIPADPPRPRPHRHRPHVRLRGRGAGGVRAHPARGSALRDAGGDAHLHGVPASRRGQEPPARGHREDPVFPEDREPTASPSSCIGSRPTSRSSRTRSPSGKPPWRKGCGASASRRTTGRRGSRSGPGGARRRRCRRKSPSRWWTGAGTRTAARSRSSWPANERSVNWSGRRPGGKQ